MQPGGPPDARPPRARRTRQSPTAAAGTAESRSAGTAYARTVPTATVSAASASPRTVGPSARSPERSAAAQAPVVAARARASPSSPQQALPCPSESELQEDGRDGDHRERQASPCDEYERERYGDTDRNDRPKREDDDEPADSAPTSASNSSSRAAPGRSDRLPARRPRLRPRSRSRRSTPKQRRAGSCGRHRVRRAPEARQSRGRVTRRSPPRQRTNEVREPEGRERTFSSVRGERQADQVDRLQRER